MCGCGIDRPCYGCSCGCDHGTPNGLREQLERMYAIYSPKRPSLREEVAGLLWRSVGSGDRDDLRRDGLADDILAVVRRHVEALTRDGRDFDGYIPEEAWEAGRDDVLRLLNGGSE